MLNKTDEMQLPLVSIIIPIYNRAGLIVETLESVLNQTYENWECIVVDDFSTDNSSEIISRLSIQDSRFKILKNTRTKGAPGARNTGVEHSRGEYLIFLDSDDLLTKKCIEIRVSKFQLYPKNDFLVFSTLEFKSEIGDSEVLINVNTSENPILRFLNMDVPWLIMGPIWKKESFLQLGYWKENLFSWQDWEMHLRALLKNYTFIYFCIVDNYWRNDDNNASIGKQSLSLKHLESHLGLCQSLKKDLSSNELYLTRLNSLIFWLGNKALEQGYKDVAIKALKDSHCNLNPLKIILNIIGIKILNKHLISLHCMPTFGTMRKIKFRNA